jgi:hypothetical protein
MAATSLNCYKIDSEPFSLILPSECIAAIVTDPVMVTVESQKAPWMAGYLSWNSQEIPLLCFENLLISDFVRPDQQPIVTILNPIPKAVRKTYGALLSFGDVQKITIAHDVDDVATPSEIDRRYVEAALAVDGAVCIIPRLAALGVAFSYY